MKLSVAMYEALRVLAKRDVPVEGGKRTTLKPRPTIHATTAHRLVVHKLAREDAILADGKVLRDTDARVRHLGQWQTYYSITSAGRRALKRYEATARGGAA